MDAKEALEGLKKKALTDEDLRSRLLGTRQSSDPYSAFCKISTQEGFPITEMELLALGEETYAQIRRSTNGGGENSPLLEWEDDYYELFLTGLY
jgi:hypothetical protein